MAENALYDATLIHTLTRYIGQTVTIFTTSGGLSGSGFTGVLAAVTPNYVKLITHIGAPPACPLGSSCAGPIGAGSRCGKGGFGFGRGGYGFGGAAPYGWLGSVTEIPLDRIASFTHNAI